MTYSEQDLKHAAEFRDEIHREALAKVRGVFPGAEDVVDRYPAEEYFQEVWDYPGKWYTMVGTPLGAGSRKHLIDSIVCDTLEYYRGSGASFSDKAFCRLIAEHPDIVCEYCIVKAGNEHADALNVFPYRGADSHRLALDCAARKLIEESGGEELTYDTGLARCRKISGKALFAPAESDEWLNYRRAFLDPPQGRFYPDSLFDQVNALLFPAGADVLEVYRWTTDWSNFFDDGREWWGTLCLTVYDRTLERFTVIMASATD